MTSGPNRQGDAGFASVEWLGAVVMSFIFLVVICNFIAVQYETGYLRDAADEGARAGALVVADPIAACKARETEVLANLGAMANSVKGDCAAANGQVHAQTSAQFAGWLPAVPAFHESATAISKSEQAPA